VTDPARSALMRRVRQARTAPEDRVAVLLRSLKIGYRRNVRGLPGTPDFANRSRRWAIFVMGCYWHHHTNCPHATVPKQNRTFWEAKFQANRRRDARKIQALRAKGIRVVLVWECDTKKSMVGLTERLSDVLKA
jgi:DNA mismatch endonuclease (patch repair protein)